MNKNKHSIGDKLKVVGRTHSHGFVIGEEIKVQSIHGEYYRCKGRHPFHYFITSQEVVKLNLN